MRRWEFACPYCGNMTTVKDGHIRVVSHGCDHVDGGAIYSDPPKVYFARRELATVIGIEVAPGA